MVSLDGGEGAQTVLTGKVHSVRREFEFIRVIVTDVGDLAGYRPSATLEGQDAQAVVNKLASDVSISTGNVDIDLDLAVYVAHPGRTAAEHIAKLAELAGGIAYSDGDGSLNVKQKPSGPADSALKYGREVISYETRSAARSVRSALPWDLGPAGSGGADDALRPSVDAIPGSAADGGAGVWRCRLRCCAFRQQRTPRREHCRAWPPPRLSESRRIASCCRRCGRETSSKCKNCPTDCRVARG